MTLHRAGNMHGEPIPGPACCCSRLGNGSGGPEGGGGGGGRRSGGGGGGEIGGRCGGGGKTGCGTATGSSCPDAELSTNLKAGGANSHADNHAICLPAWQSRGLWGISQPRPSLLGGGGGGISIGGGGSGAFTGPILQLLPHLLLLLLVLCQVPGALTMPTPSTLDPTGGIGAGDGSDSDGIYGIYHGDQQPPASVFGNRAQALVASLPQRLGLVDDSQAGGPGSNCTNCPDMASTLFRQTFEKLKLEHLQREILRQLKIERPPNVTARPTGGPKPVFRFLNREREQLRQNQEQRFGNSNFAQITEIVSYGEEAANFSDNAVVMFRLSTPSERTGSLKVMSASLYMLLRYRKHGSGRSHRESVKPRRRVKVNIYPVYPSHNLRQLEPDANKTMYGSLGVMVRHTRWQKLILPVSEIQKVVDSSSKVLHLRITCDNCGKDIEPVLASRRSQSHSHSHSHSRRKVRAGGKKKMNKRRPLLIVHTAMDLDEEEDDGGQEEKSEERWSNEDEEEGAESAAAGAAGKNQQQHRRKRLAPSDEHFLSDKTGSRLAQCSPESSLVDNRVKEHCGKRKLWISFKDMGWDDWILHPKGYYANYCEGSCAYSTFGAVDFFRRQGYHGHQGSYQGYYQGRKGLGGNGGKAGGRAGRYQHHAAYSHVIGEYSKLSPRHRKHRLQSADSVAPCCRPRKMSGLHLIYFDENGNIVRALLRDMVVDRCGCV